MTSWNPPTAAELTRLETYAARPENRAYFFDRLDNPLWVRELRERGFFSDPPEAIEVGDAGYIRFSPWPEGRYLVRMTTWVPEEVSLVLKQMEQSKNVIVMRLCFEAAGMLPEEQLRQISHKVLDWVKAPHPERFAGEAGSVICQLFRIGKAKRALQVAGALLTVRERPPSPEDDWRVSRPDAIGRLSVWQYKQVITQILPTAVEVSGLKGLKLFARLLGKALRIGRVEGEGLDSDQHSASWRPAIEDHSQNTDDEGYDRGVRNVLVSAVRDAAVSHAERGESELYETIEHLESYELVVHRRIALHVLASVTHGDSLAEGRITDRALFGDWRVTHEYANLVRSRFGQVSLDAQQVYVRWVDEGPDLERHRRWLADSGLSPLSQEEETAYVESWQRDWLSFIESHLAGEIEERYKRLIALFGKPHHPDFPIWGEAFEGDQSPMSEEDLTLMGPLEVLDYLRHWRPKGDEREESHQSRRGLGNAFKGAVTQRAEDYAPLANTIGSLGRTYVSSFLEGLRSASEAGGTFSWTEPVQLMGSLVLPPSDSDHEGQDLTPESEWRWARKAVAQVLTSGLSTRPNCIPYALREAVWRVIEPLADDPDPSVEFETRSSEGSDPFFLSINTNRGTAMHAVVEYALWCHRHLEAQGGTSKSGFDRMPEVRSVLEQHLNTESEPSRTIRAVYGRWLPWLFLLDKKWTDGNLHRIFPTDPAHGHLREAAWATYIGWCRPFNNVFLSLRAEYETAIDRVPSLRSIGMFERKTVDVSLGEHLVELYWRGVVPMDLLERFFQRADDDLCGTIMSYLGGALENTEGDVPGPIRERIQALWDRRFDVIISSATNHRSEAQAFARTFAAGKLDQDWELASFERTLQEGVGVPPMARLAIERLVQTADNKPGDATRLALKLLKQTEHEWAHLDWENRVRRLLTVTQSTKLPDVVENRKAIIEHYIQRGHHDFRQLL